MAAKKILVVFYSRSGTTRKIAEALAAELKCEIEEIVAAKGRAGFIGIMRSLIEAIRQQPAQITPAKHDLSSYDLVIIGTPVWAWSISSPVRAFLMQNAQKLPQVAFFCTLGNRGDDSTFAQMRGVTGKAPRATTAFRMQDVLAGRFHQQLGDFARALS